MTKPATSAHVSDVAAHGVQDVTSVDLPSSGEREYSKQSLSILCPFYLV